MEYVLKSTIHKHWSNKSIIKKWNKDEKYNDDVIIFWNSEKLPKPCNKFTINLSLLDCPKLVDILIQAETHEDVRKCMMKYLTTSTPLSYSSIKEYNLIVNKWGGRVRHTWRENPSLILYEDMTVDFAYSYHVLNREDVEVKCVLNFITETGVRYWKHYEEEFINKAALFPSTDIKCKNIFPTLLREIRSGDSRYIISVADLYRVRKPIINRKWYQLINEYLGVQDSENLYHYAFAQHKRLTGSYTNSFYLDLIRTQGKGPSLLPQDVTEMHWIGCLTKTFKQHITPEEIAELKGQLFKKITSKKL